MSRAVAPIVLGIIAVSFQWALAAEPGFQFFQPVVPPRPFQVVVPGGMARQTPAGSKAAIDMCAADGVEWVEVDVRLTKDGHHVLFQHAVLDGTTSGSGAVKDHTLAELKQLDAGSWFARRFASAKILTLAECLANIKGKINLCLACQDVDAAQLVKEIQAAGVERQVIVFDKGPALKRVRELSEGKIAVMTTWHPADGFGKWLDELRPAVIEIDASETTPEVCREFHARSIKVQAKMLGDWDNPRYWDKALSDGADFLRTELPEELVAHVLARQLQPRPVRLTCHRGASRYAPENTLPAFEKAARLHADFVEFDVRPSRDGTFFLLHDKQLNRTTNGKGAINDATNDAIGGLDAGAWFGRPFVGTRVPTLDEFLSAVPPGISLYFDAKDIPPEAIAAALQKHGLVDRAVVYQSAGLLEKLKQIDARIRTMPGASSTAQVTELAKTLKPYAVDTPWNVLSKQYIDHCHAAGVQVFADAPFTVDVKGYRQAIEWGIDCIQTDFPLRAWRAMELVNAERTTR